MYKGGYLILDFKGKEPELLTQEEIEEMYNKLFRECFVVVNAKDNITSTKTHKLILIENYTSDPGITIDTICPSFIASNDGGYYFYFTFLNPLGSGGSDGELTNLSLTTILIGKDGAIISDNPIYISREVLDKSF